MNIKLSSYRAVVLRVFLLLVLLIAMLPAETAVARPGDQDPSFLEPNPTGAGPVEPGNYAGALALQPDGKILVGGRFYTMNGLVTDRLARLNSDGSLDMAFSRDLTFSHAIYTIAMLSDGDFMVGGSFTAISGWRFDQLARMNSDGTVEAGFTSWIEKGSNANSPSVSVIVPLADGGMLVGGDFGAVGGVARGNIARLYPYGDLNTSFMNGMAGTNSGVRSIVVQPDGKILIAGFFSTVNGVARGRVARLNADGSLDATFMNGLSGANDIISAMALQPDGKILVGGYFTKINNTDRPYLARLNADGTLDGTFLDGLTGPNDPVRNINRLSSGKLIIGGYFTTVNDAPRGHIAGLNANGSIDPNFANNQAGADSSVLATLAQPDGRILVAGSFTRMNGAGRNYVARLGANGWLDSDFMIGGANNEVHAVELQPADGRLLVGGRFDVMNGRRQVGIARLYLDGTPDDEFFRNSGGGVTGGGSRVNSIAVQEDGGIIAGGDFTKAGHRDALNIARFDMYGNPDAYFDTAGTKGADGEVFGVAVQPDGKVVIVGNFQNAGGAARKFIARLNPNGSLDTTFVPAVPDKMVYAVAIQDDGKMIITGEFGTVGGQARGRVARLNADGSLDTGYLNGMAGASNLVRWVDIDPQGNAIIGGFFQNVNGQPCNRIARLSKTDGSADPNFLSGLAGPDNGVRTLEALPDGSILIGGEFFKVNDVVCKHIALLSADGSLDPRFACRDAAGINGGWVNDVAVNKHSIVIGGDFTQVQGAERGRVAVLDVGYNVLLPVLEK